MNLVMGPQPPGGQDTGSYEDVLCDSNHIHCFPASFLRRVANAIDVALLSAPYRQNVCEPLFYLHLRAPKQCVPHEERHSFYFAVGIHTGSALLGFSGDATLGVTVNHSDLLVLRPTDTR